jgi:hypothetical protein
VSICHRKFEFIKEVKLYYCITFLNERFLCPFSFSMNNAFVYEEGIGGVCSWNDYPYVGHKHWIKGCEKRKCIPAPFSDVSGFVNVTQTDFGLMEALLIQPVSVAVDAASVSA